MQTIVSKDLWVVVRRLAIKADQRKAAISYVTQDLIGFRKGDVLIVDASPQAIASGATKAPLLRDLAKKGVVLHDCGNLHAKVLVLGHFAVIGSCNMSHSSADVLVEAAIITDHVSTVSGALSFIQQLMEQSPLLDAGSIDNLCKIKVIRRSGFLLNQKRGTCRTQVSELGNRTWLLGVHEMARAPSPSEQVKIDEAAKELKEELAAPEDLEWLRWGTKSRFARECKKGDTVIQMWRSSHAKRPSKVYRAVSILLKQETPTWTRFYLQPSPTVEPYLSWGKFQLLLKSLGYSRRVGPSSEHLLDADMADAISRKWKVAK